MTDRSKGSFGQKNYSQMGDKHSKGKDNILADGSNAKDKNSKWQELALKNKSQSGNKVKPPNTPQKTKNGKDAWQKKILSERDKTVTPKVPSTQIKQISKAKQVTKSK